MAWGISDLVALLDRWDVWKQVRENAGRVPALEARVAALEACLAAAPGRNCPACGKPAWRVIASAPDPDFGEVGMVRRTLACSECGFTEARTEEPTP